MKKITLMMFGVLFLFTAFGQVSKTNTISGTVTNVPWGGGGMHIDRTFDFTAGDFPSCSGLTEVEISIRLILGNGTPPTLGAYGVHEDLNVRLVSPTGTAVDLVQDRWGYWTGGPQTNTYSGFTAVDGTMHFDDDHPTNVAPVAVTEWTTGNFSPHNPLSTFDGENPVGTWTLRISDGDGQYATNDYFHFVESTLTVTCGVACTEPTIPTVTATTNPICNGASTTLNISGTLNDATQWHVYTGFCGVTQIGTTSGTTFAVSPTSTTTYYIRGEGGCATPGTCGAITVTVNPNDDASFSYSASSYCVNSADPTPTITGLAGGTFSSTAGLSLNASTGAIDVSASTPGTYTVTYTTAGSCPSSSNVSVTINALDDPSFSYSASSYCVNSADPTPTITGLAGGTFTSTAGLSLNASTGAIDVSASTPGTYTVTYTTAGACPNSSNVTVSISGATTGTDTQIACDSYTWIDGNTYTSSNNTATFTLTNAAGCDSIVTLDLTINSSTTGTDVQTACDSYTWIDGNTYTTSNNTATFTLSNAAGCDSVVTLDLTINNSTTGTDVQTACDSYTWIDGNTYTSSNNTATFTIANGATNGCDSIVTLDLTILNSTTGTDVQTACGSYTWIDGNTYTASNNTATFTVPNAAGCDSIITLDLTINNTVFHTDVQVACDTYSWNNGMTYTSSTNTPVDTLVSAAGCDSIVTLDLTILNSTTGTDVISACESYTWIDGNTYTASNNSATFTLMNAAGCDSVVTLDLTINNAVTSTDVITTCDGSYTWIDGNTYTSSNNTATYTIVGGASTGCDSIITLNLTLNTFSAPLTVTVSDPLLTADATGVYFYQWLDCNNGNDPIPGATAQMFSAPSNGSYAVRIQDEFGCMDTSGCYDIVTLDLDAINNDISVVLVPNPTSNGQFRIETSAAINAIQILDVTGKEMKASYDKFTQTVQADFIPGVYYVRVMSDNWQEVLELLVTE